MDLYTNMALGRSSARPGFPGDIATGLISEHNQRYFYRRWQEHMVASSWADVPRYNVNSPAAGQSA
jgi:ethylbenzene dioxygenase subunit alpha